MIAFALLLCSCNSQEVRGDAVSFDNPTSENYFVVVDEDTLPLPAYTFIESYLPVCTGAENISYANGHLPGEHRYRILDANKKQLFDTTILAHDRYLMINPTRSTYAEWTIFYGDSLNGYKLDTIYLDSVPYIGKFKFYNSFAIENECRHGLECSRAIEGSMKLYDGYSPEGFTAPGLGMQTKFLRLDDFLVACNGSNGLTEKEAAEVKLHNVLTSLYNNTVENWTHPFRNGEVQLLSDYLFREQYDKAVDLINVNSDFFTKHDPEAVAEMNRQYAIYQQPSSGSSVLPFTRLSIATYDFDEDGKPYINQQIEYHPDSGECTKSYYSPAQK